MLPSGGAETESGFDSTSQVRKTRKDEWWQLHGRSTSCIGCASVVPPSESVGCHGPEELWHQMLRPRNVASECLAMDRRMIGVEVHEPQIRLVGYAHVCSLRWKTCRVCASAATAPCSLPVATVAFQVATNPAHRKQHVVAPACAQWRTSHNMLQIPSLALRIHQLSCVGEDSERHALPSVKVSTVAPCQNTLHVGAATVSYFTILGKPIHTRFQRAQPQRSQQRVQQHSRDPLQRRWRFYHRLWADLVVG